MSKRRRRSSTSGKDGFSSSSSSRRSKRSGLQTTIETLMGVGAAVLLVAVGIWWFVFRPTGEAQTQEKDEIANEAVVGNVIEDENAYETILEGNELGKLEKLLLQLDNWKRDAPFAVKLDTLDRRIEVADAILKHQEVSEELRVKVARKLLSAYGQYYGISNEQGLTDDGAFVAKYVNVCNEYINDGDIELAKFAKMSRAKAQVYQMTSNKTAGSMASIQQTIVDLATSYPDDAEAMLTVRQLLARIKQADVRVAGKLGRELVSIYDRSSPTDEDVKRQLRGMKDQILLEDSNIGLIARDAQTSGNYEPYFKKLDELLSHNDTGIGFVNRMYDPIKFFEGVERYDLALRVIEKLAATWESRTDIAAQQQAFRMAKFGRLRHEILGKKIDLNDIQSNGQPINTGLLEGKPCIVFYYSPNAPNTREMFNKLNFTYKLLFNTNVRVIAIEVEPARQGSFIESFDPTWISVSSSVERTSKIFKQCPATNIPYFIVVRGDGIVDSIGVPEDKLKTKIDALAAQSAVAGDNKPTQ